MKVVLHMGDPYILDNPCTKRMSTFASELIKRGHEVVILAPDTPGIEKEEGVVYCKTPPLKKKTTINRLLNQGCLALSSYAEGKKVRNVDVVLTTCPPPLINISGAKIAQKHHAKLIYDVRDVWPDVALEMGSFSDASIYSKVFEYFRNYMLKHANLVTAVSEGKVNKLQTYNKNALIKCIPNGFNIGFLDNSVNQQLLADLRAKGDVICSYIGNLGLAQGIRQYIDLANKANKSGLKAAFLVYGSGAEEKILIDYVSTQGLTNVFFMGRLPNKDMRTVLEASDVNFVSLVNGNLKDSVPTKLYEALGVGCPVLLVAEGDSVDILNATGHGRAVTPNDDESIWQGFMDIVNNLEYFNKKKKEVQKLIADNYSLQQSALMMADLMEKLVQ